MPPSVLFKMLFALPFPKCHSISVPLHNHALLWPLAAAIHAWICFVYKHLLLQAKSWLPSNAESTEHAMNWFLGTMHSLIHSFIHFHSLCFASLILIFEQCSSTATWFWRCPAMLVQRCLKPEAKAPLGTRAWDQWGAIWYVALIARASKQCWSNVIWAMP